MSARLVIVGGGNMGTALVRGLIGSGWSPEWLVIAEVETARRDSLEDALPGVVISHDPLSAEGAVVAVKPADAETACRKLSTLSIGKVLSVMAGVRLSSLEEWIGQSVAVVRAMPNTPALVGAGASALAGGSGAREGDLAWAEEILGAVGTVVRVTESSLDAVTGLSGSGPGYLFYVAEAMIEAGTRIGLSEAVSRSLVLQTFLGSARMLLESGEPPESLRGRVTSPGGTTQAGLAVLAERQVADAFAKAIEAAAKRSSELGS